MTFIQAVVFNEGELVLDDCDFSESEASVLVYTDSAARTTVRNAVLGNKNCELHHGKRDHERRVKARQTVVAEI